MMKYARAKVATHSGWRPSAANLFVVVILFAAIYLIVPKLVIKDYDGSMLAAASATPVALAVVGLLLTYLFAAGLYMVLSPRRLRLLPTYLLQVAGSFAGRLLPAGLGAIGVGFLYLRRQGCSAGQAAAVVATNNLLGFVGNAILLAGLFIIWPQQFGSLTWPRLNKYLLIGVVVGLVLIWWLARRPVWRRKLHDLWGQLMAYRRQPARLALALLLSLALTAAYAVMLFWSGEAYGVHLSYGLALAAMTAGVALGAGTPTPGGLGGVEAGIIAVLVGSGLDYSSAFGTALLYRLISYWLAIAIGLPAFLLARHKRYI